MNTGERILIILILVIILVIIIIVVSKIDMGSLTLPQQPTIKANPIYNKPKIKKWNKTVAIKCLPKSNLCRFGGCGAELPVGTELDTSIFMNTLEECQKKCSDKMSGCLNYNKGTQQCLCVGSCPSNIRKNCKHNSDWDLYQYGYS